MAFTGPDLTAAEPRFIQIVYFLADSDPAYTNDGNLNGQRACRLSLTSTISLDNLYV